MVGLGVVLVLLIGGVSWAVSAARRRALGGGFTQPPLPPAVGGFEPDADPRLIASLDAWQHAGIIDASTRDAIVTFERNARHAATAARPTRARRVPLVAEALGYLGGILGVVGLVLLVTRYWPDMATASRLAISAAGAIGLAIGGLAVRANGEGALIRLQAALLLAATACSAVVAGVIAVDVFDANDPPVTALACAATVALVSVGFWRFGDRPVQQATCLAALPVTAGLVMHQVASDGFVGLAVMVMGLLLLAIGVQHVTTMPPITVGIGAAAAEIGAGITISDWRGPGVVVLLLTASVVLLLAGTHRPVRTDAERIVLTVVGGVGMLQGVPGSIGHFAERAGIVTGLVVWVAGLALLATGGSSLFRTPLVVRLLGGAALVGGAAVTGAQSVAFATLFGLATAVVLIALGTMPDRVLLSLFGSVGLLVNVPWAIRHFFPGEGRVPLLILVSGLVIVGVAVMLSRQGGRLRHEFRHTAHG
ncbi:MAG: DUF2157 domain-containing protein [Actinomycetota bacterium]